MAVVSGDEQTEEPESMDVATALILTGFRVGDASVRFGGLFDSDASAPWESPYCKHRHGLSVDLVGVRGYISAVFFRGWLTLTMNELQSAPSPLKSTPDFWPAHSTWHLEWEQ